MAKPSPVPDPHTRPFWDAARERRLAIQFCPGCSTYQHPPGFVCRSCQSRELEFRDVSGRGTLYSFTVSEQSFVPGFEELLPLPIGLVQLDERGIVRLMTNIPLEYADGLELDMPMHVVFEELDDGSVLPQFLPS